MKTQIIFAGVMLALESCTGSSQTQTPKDQMTDNMEKSETATLGAGCFWCVEAIYQYLDGVVKVQSGYSGGSVKNPSYTEVCNGTTGHAEVVQVTFNPDSVSYSEILEVFFETHDPTTLNRQGADKGTQYRSVIYYHSDEQKRIAQTALKAANESGNWPNPVVTEISPIADFYPAEDYHQEYFALNGEAPYCQMVIAPKVDKFKKKFQEKLKQ
ncbi:MAG: peptide-methionine (S)-S-oxide reductase MsrA [Flavobacteriales bacterium]|nr:peptide-methionine (S)-S-oxide reductase MsrA [Flavobacteriales bacterium]